MVKTGGWFANVLKKDLDWLFRLVSNDSSSATNRALGWDMPRLHFDTAARGYRFNVSGVVVGFASRLY